MPVEDRLAVFDNDGTLWCEKPMPIQLDFILRRLVDMARCRSGVARAPAGKAAERDVDGWAGHGAVPPATTPTRWSSRRASWRRMTASSVEDFEAQADAFLRNT